MTTPYPYPALALLKYKPPPGSAPTSIRFEKGDRITVLAQADDDGDWLEGVSEKDGGRGVFPSGFVERVEGEEAQGPLEGSAGVKEDEEGGAEAQIEQQDQEKEDEKATPAVEPTPAAAVEQPEETAPPSPPPAPAPAPAPIASTPVPSAPAPIEAPRDPVPTPSTTAAAPGPPPAAKKPSGLQARLAFFQQQAEQQVAAAGPPVVQSKPGGWKRPAPPPSAPAPVAAASPPPPPSSASTVAAAPCASPPLSRTLSATSDSADPEHGAAGLSAADAQESIGRGGGSLKDRIKALQGLKVETPQAPGRAPKPWRKKTEEVEEESSEVKDEEPKIGETNEEKREEDGGVPGFEPAEEAEGEEAKKEQKHVEPAPEAVAPPFEEATALPPPSCADDGAVLGEPVETKEETEEAPKKKVPSAAAALLANEDDFGMQETPLDTLTPSSPVTAPTSLAPLSIPTSLPSTTAPAAPAAPAAANDEAEEDDESAKRAAIAARMAGLGGQRMGLPMPALPKRTAGPKRGGAKKAVVPAAEETHAEAAPPAEEVAPAGVREEERSVEKGEEKVGEHMEEEKVEEEKAEKQVKANDEVQPVIEVSESEPEEEDDDAWEPVQNDSEDEADRLERLKLKGSKEHQLSPDGRTDIFAAMGLPSPLQGKFPFSPSPEPQYIDEDDGWDTPAPTAPPTRRPTVVSTRPVPPIQEDEEEVPKQTVSAAPPVAPIAEHQEVQHVENVATHPAEYDDPELEEGEELVGEEELSQRVGDDEPKRTIAEEAVEALPLPDQKDDLLVRSAETSLEEAPVDPDVRLPTAEEVQDQEQAYALSSALPPLPVGRPPVPPPFTRQPTVPPVRSQTQDEIAALPSTASDASTSATADAPVRPPIPTHPPPANLPSVLTPSERAFILSQPEILSPAEEGFDESTAGVHLDAPSVGKIAEAHEEREGGLPAMVQPKEEDGREEGVATPAFEAEPQEKELAIPKAPMGRPNAAVKKATLEAARAEEAIAAAEKNEEVKEASDNEEEESGSEEETEEEEEDEEEEEEDPEIARRRALAARMAKLGGAGRGGMGMGMGMPMFGGLPPAPPAKVKKTTKKKKSTREEKKVESEVGHEQAIDSLPASEGTTPDPTHPPRRIGGIPTGGFALPGIARLPQPSDDEPRPAAPARDSDIEVNTTDVAENEEDYSHGSAQTDEVEHLEEEEQAPPPLPAGRPPTRSIPPPAAIEHEEAQEDVEAQPEHASHFVEEPEEAHVRYEGEEEEAAPPPPPRPAGGHQSSLPVSPPLPSTSSFSSPPTRSVASPSIEQQQHLTRSPTQSSNKRSSTLFSNAAEKLGFASSPRQSMDLAGEERPTSQFSSPAIPQQSQAPPPSSSSHPQAFDRATLQRHSASLGAQVFAAAFALKASSARGFTSDYEFVQQCFGKASGAAQPTREGEWGVKVYEALAEGGKKGSLVNEEDEPRTGDIISISAKFKHALSSKVVGSDAQPHLAIVVGWDPKKAKVTVLQVEKGKDGKVEEGSYKVEEMRGGRVTVWRVVPAAV